MKSPSPSSSSSSSPSYPLRGATDMFFSHEKLEVYQRAIEFVVWRRKLQNTEMRMKSEEDINTTDEVYIK